MRWNVTLVVTLNDEGKPLDLGWRVIQEAPTAERAIMDGLARLYARNGVKPEDVLEIRVGAGSNEIDLADLPG